MAGSPGGGHYILFALTVISPCQAKHPEESEDD
jgi:hypothetical protein